MMRGGFMEERPEGKGILLDGVSINQMRRRGSKGVGWVKDSPQEGVVLMKMFGMYRKGHGTRCRRNRSSQALLGEY